MPEEDRWQRLADVIQQWNSNRLDLFEISQPSKTLDFSGVMRFCLEDPVGGSFATKCLRIGSSSTTRDVIEMLLEKFRPDMKMLTTPYCLYEVHANVERKLDIGEKPLVVQLNWNTDNREGRFVLKTEQDLLSEANCHEKKKKTINSWTQNLDFAKPLQMKSLTFFHPTPYKQLHWHMFIAYCVGFYNLEKIKTKQD